MLSRSGATQQKFTITFCAMNGAVAYAAYVKTGVGAHSNNAHNCIGMKLRLAHNTALLNQFLRRFELGFNKRYKRGIGCTQRAHGVDNGADAG